MANLGTQNKQLRQLAVKAKSTELPAVLVIEKSSNREILI